jgi:hypothetical protein
MGATFCTRSMTTSSGSPPTAHASSVGTRYFIPAASVCRCRALEQADQADWHSRRSALTSVFALSIWRGRRVTFSKASVGLPTQHAWTFREGSRGAGNRSGLLQTVRVRRKRGWPMPMVPTRVN